MTPRRLLSLAVLLSFAAPVRAESRVLDPALRHLRIDGMREWEAFPESPESARLDLTFSAERNATEQTLRLRQQDVKQTWRVRLNDREIGRLTQDENDMVVYLPIPPGTLVAGENRLRIEQEQGGRPAADDIRVGEVRIDPRLVREVLSEAPVEVTVTEDGEPVPCRITVLNADGALQTTWAEPDDRLAVRPGVIYTADGRARFGLPAGRYTIHAGRGFEYSLATADVTAAAGETVTVSLSIRREVPTAGWVACDTHVHTLTHSGHGDATEAERMVTVAGEGIELAIATDHNKQIDYDPAARAVGVRERFTPLVGNEVTTKVGHFNVFPVTPGGEVPDHTLTEWPAIFEAIERAGAKVVILNHARDLHSGFRPFGPGHFNAAAGERLDGRPVGFNAMEVVNSGATQTDPTRLLRDWLALLNAGHTVTPVGSSDSHDVARYAVGQGRTYIRCGDGDPGDIDLPTAIENFLNGRVMVSYGLLAELTVEERFGPGDVAEVKGDEVRVSVRVLGPHWVTADRVELFANGVKVREASIPDGHGDLPPGVKWAGGWTLPKPPHDVHLVAAASGPGIDGLYWPTAKPYQPTSPRWTPRVLGCSGAVRVDADGDGGWTSARGYAERIRNDAGGNLSKLVAGLAGFDEAVATQAAWLYEVNGGSPTDPALRQALTDAPPAVRVGFQAYLEAWRESQTARAAE
ncbi:MAG TPA: CehA/McbA family metallohydrolase [Planctomycetaceae bacterium]